MRPARQRLKGRGVPDTNRDQQSRPPGLPRTRQRARALDERDAQEAQKRYLAYLDSLRSDERYYLARSQLQMRWFEATLEEKEERDAQWCQRRMEHRLQSDARKATLSVRAARANPV